MVQASVGYTDIGMTHSGHTELCSAHKQRVMRALGACAEALQLCPPREEGDNTHKSQHGDAPVAQVDRAVDS